MKKKSLLSKLVLAALASGMLCANVGFAANVTKNANDITADYTLNQGDTLTLTGGVLSHNIVPGAQGRGETVIDGSVVLMEGKSIDSVLTVNQGRDLKVNGILAGQTNNKGVLTLSNGATNTGMIRNYGTISIGDGFTIGNQIASRQTGSDTVNVTGTVVVDGVESGKYALGASVLNVTSAKVSSADRRSLRAYETTITNSTIDTDVIGLWRGDSPTNEVYGNTLTVVNSTLKQRAAAGQNSTYQETMGNVYNNSVSISGSEVASVDGAYNVIYDSTSLTKAYTAGDVYGNSVVISNNSTVTKEVYGGESFVMKNGNGSSYLFQHKTGNVYNNSVEITNSTAKGAVYGGYSRDGKVYGNTASFVKAKLAADIYGGYTDYGSVDGNKVIITSETPNSGETNIDGGTDGIDIIGGYIKLNTKSNATNNEVIINGAKIEGSGDFNVIAGGKSAGGSANGNSVKLSEIGLKNNTEALIAGGYVRAIFDPSVTSPVVLGSANNNKVVMNGYVLCNGAGANVYGGYIGAEGFDKTSEEHKTALKTYYSDGGASNNTVEITPSDSEVSVVLYDVFGGSTVTGNANDNTVKLNGKNIVVEHHVYGGYSGAGNVTGNSLTLSDGKYLADINAQGLVRYVGGFSEVGDVSTNQVILGTDTSTPKFYNSAWVIGGVSKNADDKSEGIVSGNNITIYNAAFNLVESGEDVVQRYTHIVGGRGGDGDVTNNSLVIKNITLNAKIGDGDDCKNNVWGGFAQNEGNVSGNSIAIEKGILNINLMAGGSSNFGAATNNTVTIIGRDTVINGGTIFGGRCYQGEGEVSGNVVDISNATIKANVFGGWSSVQNKAHDNKVYLNAVTVGSSTEETYSINASTNNNENTGGIVQVKSGGLVNNANLTLGSGKVQIDGAVTGNGNLTIRSNTGEINASVTQNSLTIGVEGNTTATVTASMDNIHVTTLTNNGTFNVSGTLKQAINGNGTNKVLQNTILSLGANASMSNLIVAGTLNLQNDAFATTTIAELIANAGAKVNFDAKFSAFGDQISATTASGTLALGSIGLKEDFEGDVGASTTYTLLKDGAANIALTGSAEAVMGAYKYVFTPSTTAGTLKVTKDYGYSLQAIIQDSEPNHVAGKVSNYSLNGDKTLDADLGTLTRVDSTKAREFTINGNGNKLLGNGKNGITVNSGDTLTYKDIAEVSGFNGAAVTNNGTFNLQGVTMKNGIAGGGTTVVENGTSAFEANVANAVKIAATGGLKTKGAYITNTVDNAGEYHFLGGEVNRAVTGAGTMFVEGNAVFNAPVGNSLSVASGKTVTGNADLSVAVIDLNDAVLNMASGKKLTVTSKLNMIGGDTVVALDKDNVLDAALKVKTGLGDIINGTDGTLFLRFDGAEYTATSHRDARLALFGNGENAALQFDNAVLKIDTVNETLGVQGQKNGNEVSMSGVQPTVYDKSGNKIEDVGDQADKTVGIIDNTGGLVAADKVSLGGASNVTAKDLQIESVVTAGQTFEVLVNGASTLSLVGSDGYLVRNKSNVAVTTNIAVESSTLVIGRNGAAAPTAIGGLDTLTITNSAASLYNIIVNAVKLAMGTGGKLWIDPSYAKVDTITIASGVSVGAATDGSVLNIAMTENNLQKALEAAGVDFDANSKLVGAENGVFAYNAKTLGTLDLTGDRHLVVADELNDQYALELGAGSVLVVETAKDKAAAFKVGSPEDVSVDGNTAKLVVSADDFEAGVSEYKILTAAEGEFDELWRADNVFASDPTYKLTFKGAGSVYTLTTDWNKVEGIFGDGAIAAPEMYDRMLQRGGGTDANRFLKNVINATAGAGSTDASKAAGANALNSAANLNGVANVEHGLYTAFNMGSEALYTHLGDKGQERGIWANYINNKETVDGFNLGAGLEADYDAKYNGVIVGADLVKTQKSIMGISVNYTTGDVTSNGNIRTNNDSKYYGVSLYGKTELGEETGAALLYDVSYMHGKSEITQHNFGQEITADAKSDAFSVGLRAQKDFKLGQGSLTPYIGLRYLHIGTGDYESNLKMKYDAADLNMVLLPVGLTYKANIQSGKTTWSPMVSVGYLWNLSGKDTTQNTSFDGVKSSFDYDVADRGSFFARLGIEAQAKNVTYGIGYQFMKGSNTRNNRWNVNVNFSF